jgi:hypothetical protein
VNASIASKTTFGRYTKSCLIGYNGIRSCDGQTLEPTYGCHFVWIPNFRRLGGSLAD